MNRRRSGFAFAPDATGGTVALPFVVLLPLPLGARIRNRRDAVRSPKRNPASARRCGAETLISAVKLGPVRTRSRLTQGGRR